MGKTITVYLNDIFDIILTEEVVRRLKKAKTLRERRFSVPRLVVACVEYCINKDLIKEVGKIDEKTKS